MINIDSYIIKHRQLPHFTADVAQHVFGGYEKVHGASDKQGPRPIHIGPIYNIKWGENQRSVRHGVMESGFLWDGLHWDTLGLYDRSSLNLGFPVSETIIPTQDLLKLLPIPPSKFRQPKETRKWEGVVLALQNPTDRSVMTIAHERDYYAFVDLACAHYGKRLFLKLHPWNKGEVEETFRESAERHGCTIGRADHSILDNCQFCLVFNSTFAFDCFLRGIPVVQYAPGYFWNTGAVQYTHWSFPTSLGHGSQERVQRGRQLVDFCVWNYMIHCKIRGRDWVRLIRHLYDHRNERWPLMGYQHLSWAGEMVMRHLPDHPAAKILRMQRTRYDDRRPALPDLVDAPETDPVELAEPV